MFSFKRKTSFLLTSDYYSKAILKLRCKLVAMKHFICLNKIQLQTPLHCRVVFVDRRTLHEFHPDHFVDFQ